MRQVTLGSLFDGIGGWPLAALHAGIRPVWSSEIEKFPLAVTKTRSPDMVQLGDRTKIDGAAIEPVDVVCMGSPCQDLSIAGRQEGLKGERSGLFYRAIELIRRMRSATGGRYPRFIVWENVPGAFSSNRGVVRRLTSRECERLQGLPDDWTLIDDKSCSDSARYRAIGNGMAQPCADFIIRRIAEAIRRERDHENRKADY